MKTMNRPAISAALAVAALLQPAGRPARAADYFWSPAIAATYGSPNNGWNAFGSIDGLTYTNFVFNPDWDFTSGSNPNGNANYAFPMSLSSTNLIFGAYLPPSYLAFDWYTSNNNLGTFTLNSLEFSGERATQGFTLTGNALSFLSGSVYVNNDFVNTVNNNVSIATSLVVSGTGTGAVRYGGVLSGNGGLTLSNASGGPGFRATLAGTATYAGVTSIGANTTLRSDAVNSLSALSRHDVNGTLDLRGNSNVIGALSGTGQITNTWDTDVRLTVAGPGSGTTYSGSIRDGGGGGKTGLTVKQASGVSATYTLTLDETGGATHSGDTIVESGARLDAGADSAFSPNSTHQVDGEMRLNGTKQTVGGLSGSGKISNGSGANAAELIVGANGASTTYGGRLDDGGPRALSLTKVGAGTLTLTNANELSGGVKVLGGTVAISDRRSLGTGVLTLDGGTLRLNARANDATFSSITLGAAGGAIDTNGFRWDVPQVIGGPGGLEKRGAGRLNLTGANTYTGQTVVSGGTLAINNAAPSGSYTGGVVVKNGATLEGSGFISGDLSVEAGGVLAPGNSAGLLTVFGDLSLAAGGILRVEIGAPNVFDIVTVAGNADISSATLQIEFINGYVPGEDQTFDFLRVSNNVTGDFGQVQFPNGYVGNVSRTSGAGGGTVFRLGAPGALPVPSAAPEPGTVALLLGGMLSAAGAAWRRR